MSAPSAVRLDQVSRRFGNTLAVDGVSIDIHAGEFFSLLGPSGCGKTTTLRMIAGFEVPDGGTVSLQGTAVNHLRPWQRPIGMVFQNYALFPHLRVDDNVAFGLRERGINAREARARAATALELVRLDPVRYLRRKPSELSGGERQRVALARALILEPPILLLDEPLAALDLQLRKAMELELRELNRTLGTTFITVTHDQEEAMVMSDRIAVMQHGRVEQVGTPRGVYDTPRTEFVARFIGDANILKGRVESSDGTTARVASAVGAWMIGLPAATRGAAVTVALRPERLHLTAASINANDNAIPGVMRDWMFMGERAHAIVGLVDGTSMRVAVGRNEQWQHGDAVNVCWQADAACVVT